MRPVSDKLTRCPFCVVPFCGRKTVFGAVCGLCKKGHALDGALSCIPYAHPLIQQIIHAWKYTGVRGLANDAAFVVQAGLLKTQNRVRQHNARLVQSGADRQLLLLSGQLPAFLLNKQAIFCPIPLHRKKQKQRGFNQSEDLARATAALTGHWPVRNLLTRPKRTAAQAMLTGHDRLLNMAGAFCVRDELQKHIQGKDIVLVDDVLTTGSTCEQAARALKQHNARAVWALTLAFGHPTA